jgi:hypothetical protein
MGLSFDETKHIYKSDGLVIPSVTQIMQSSGLVNLEWISQEILDNTSDLGKKVHKTTELLDKGTLDIETLHPTLRNYLNGWIKFRKDFDFIPTEIELQLFHELYKYAGRIDRVGMIGKDLTLLDIKSGTKQKSHAIQTMGYKLLYDQNKKKPEQIKRRLIVYLSEDGYKIEEHKEETDKNIFLAALTITNFLRNNK